MLPFRMLGGFGALRAKLLCGCRTLHRSDFSTRPHGVRSPDPLKLNFSDTAFAFRSMSTAELVRAYFVFKACLIPPLVKHSETCIRFSYRILGDSLTDWFLRKTFFGLFCAGQDTESIGPTVRRLERSGIGSILDYAAEADIGEEDSVMPPTEEEQKIKVRVYDYVDESECDARKKIFERCIRSSHAVSSHGFAAIKCTALGPPVLIERMSTAITELRNLFNKFDDNNDGTVNKDEFRRAYKQYFEGTEEDVERIFKQMDVDNDNTIDYVAWSNTLRLEDLHKLTDFCKERGPLAKATLGPEERKLLFNMRARIHELAELASDLGVSLMIDAEHTYFQPGIDNIATSLMRRHNRDRPVIFGTYQMYLKDGRQRLTQDLERAKEGGYIFAAKIVSVCQNAV
eukprot:GDKH01000819.1.p1 GENE.GDKH01000819.1~~GDKH01000819.1.p1  ORF type:complete len:400 (-),score=53.28 GDKH01000819.1:25-1224(-)